MRGWEDAILTQQTCRQRWDDSTGSFTRNNTLEHTHANKHKHNCTNLSISSSIPMYSCCLVVGVVVGVVFPALLAIAITIPIHSLSNPNTNQQQNSHVHRHQAHRQEVNNNTHADRERRGADVCMCVDPDAGPALAPPLLGSLLPPSFQFAAVWVQPDTIYHLLRMW